MDAPGVPVAWTGSGPSPAWLDIAREYTDRWVHHQPMRRGRQAGTDERGFHASRLRGIHACTATRVRGPHAPEGTTVRVTVVGPSGGTWSLRREAIRWRLGAGSDLALADGRRFAVVRYMANGALDPTFGGDGIVQTDLSPGGDVAYDIAIQPNRKIVAVGPAFFHRGPRFAVVRYLPNGALDPTFGGDGKVFTGAWAQARAVVLLPDGRIVVGGGDSYGLMLVRYRRSGSLDPTFGTEGVVRRVVQALFPLAMGLQPNGKIVVGGDWDIFLLGLARFDVRRAPRQDVRRRRRGADGRRRRRRASHRWHRHPAQREDRRCWLCGGSA